MRLLLTFNGSLKKNVCFNYLKRRIEKKKLKKLYTFVNKGDRNHYTYIRL